MRISTCLWTALVAAGFAGVGAAHGAGLDVPIPAGVEHVVSLEGIHEYRLANGLEVVLWPDPSKAQTTVNITYLVGSMHEGYGETGMAHLLEHMLFKGSTNHPNVPDELTAHGARPNGTTWFDRTNYFETFAATEENLAWALDLEADRMVNSFIRQEDLDSEMSVVRNEFEIGENEPRSILEERVYSTAFLWHNYGNSTIGARSDIENVPIPNLRAFYETWYRPENAILVVAGKFDAARALQLVAEKFGPLENPEKALPPVYTREPAQDGERRVSLTRVGEVQAAAVAYHMPAGSHPDFPALEVLAHVLGSAPSGRLHTALVETGMATAVDGRADRFKDPALFFLSAEVPKGKDLGAVEETLIASAEAVAATPPTEEEVERAINALLRRFEQTQRNTSWAAVNLSEWASMGDWRLMYLYRDRLSAVKPADVARVANDYLRPSNRTVGLFHPTEQAERVEIPETPSIEEMLANYSGGEGMAMGAEFDPSPANIEAKLERLVLANGLEALFLPKETRGETVNLELALHFGTLESLANKALVGELTAAMLDRGTATRTRQEIRDDLDRLQATLSIRGGAAGVTASVETVRANFPEVLAILGDVLRNPNFEAGEFRQLKEERRVRAEERKTDPRSQVWMTLGRHLDPYPASDPRATRTPEEDLAALEPLTREDLVAFHTGFYGANHAELAIAGNFDPSATTTLVKELFEGWNSPQPYEPIVSLYAERPAIVERIQIPDKESASMAAGLRVEMQDTDAQYPAAALGSFMLGGGFLNSRLATRIRQQEGLSYSVFGWYQAPWRGTDGRLGAFAMYAPQNDERLLEAFRDEMRKAVEVPFTAEEVAEAKTGWLQQRQMSRSNDRELVGQLVQNAEADRTMKWAEEFEAKVAEVTAEDITAVMKRIIIPEQISIVRAGDFEKAAAAVPGKSSSSSSLAN